MYRGRLWTMRQYAGFGTAAESNRRYHYLLSQGVSGLSVAFDLPTQMGYDSDHPLAQGEVGRVGVAIYSIDDMEELFAGIPLDRVSTSMTINATAVILLALYIAVALMFIEVDTFPSSIPAKSRSMSSTESMATPTRPTSPRARGLSESWPICVGRSKAVERPV